MGGRSWTVGIVGTFDVENYGDLLFPLIAETELRRRLGDVRVRAFSYYSKKWPYEVTSVLELPQLAASLDGLLIGGGFLIRFDREVAPGYEPPSGAIHHPTGYWLTPALIAHEHGVPVAWNAPGMHCNEIPPWGEPLVKLAFEQSRYVAVRDEPSREKLSSVIAADSIAVVPDSGFGIARLLPKERSRELEAFRAATGIKGSYILVQVSDSMAAHAGLFSHIDGVQAVAMPISPVLTESVDHFGDDFLKPRSWPHPLVLAELIAGAVAVAGHSYHLAITALMSGVPVFTPVDLRVGKFTALRQFDGIQSLPGSHPELIAKLTRRKPPTVDVDQHWDRVASAIEQGPSAPQVAMSKFWQAVPVLLEGRAPSGGSRRMLDLDRIMDSQLQSEPFRWGTVDRLYSSPDAALLIATYPRDHFRLISGYGGEKDYEYEARPLIAMGASEIQFELYLSDAWRSFARTLLSAAYREVVAAISNCDLRDALLEVNVFHYGPGASLGPHSDLPDKIVTHVLYFNEEWDAADGGCLQILSAKDERAVVHEVLPLIGNSAFLVRSENSWHALSRVAEGCKRSRRSVTATFYRPGSVSSIWPPGETFPELHKDRDDLHALIDGARAERIVMLERQLEARAAALDAATQECARLKTQLRPLPPPEAPAVHHLPWLSLRERVWKTFVILGGRLLPRPAKRFVRKFWDPGRVARRVPVRQGQRQRQTSIVTTATFDVVCFSIIDWSFRWQRPQQLLSQFANAGHRVFLFKTTAFLPSGRAKFEIVQVRENVWELTIGPPMLIDVYSGVIDPATIEWFPSLLEKMRHELNIVAAVSLVQIATWAAVAEEARRRFGWKVVYDCMDEWNSFPGMKPQLLETEETLVAKADLVTVSARRLLEKWQGRNARVELIRNAADYAHFSAPHSEHFLNAVKRPIVGYFGAIAAWFDVGLLARIASQRPDLSFVVIGGVFDVDAAPLQRLPNVHLLGQQPYARMPAYLQDFDVCMIPFLVNEITAATDPVKFYEYISLGKPVVSTAMPELEPFGGLLYLAADEDDFLRKIDLAVAERDESLRAHRVDAARANIWPARAERMLRAIADVHPRVSVIIVSYNNHELTRACIDSVLRNSLHPNLEIIVVDNASQDGSAEMLHAMRDERLHVLLNDQNAGFAAANNQALREATGAHIVLLNNDTVVPRGWLPRLLRHLEDPQIGLTVAVTNFSGNESRIDVPYRTVEEMSSFAEEYMRSHEGERFDIRVAAMYCVGMRREVFDRVGPLDEQFTIGMFEDDDYSHRVRLAGLRVICAEDVFVHHAGQASFSKLHPDAYEELWKRNQACFENKWGLRWEPHRLR